MRVCATARLTQSAMSLVVVSGSLDVQEISQALAQMGFERPLADIQKLVRTNSTVKKMDNLEEVQRYPTELRTEDTEME